MNKNKEIVLGFTKVLKKYTYDSESEEEEEFPSKIGGQPIWMQKNNIPQDVKCKLCEQNMVFLMQLYSPLSYSQSYYRCLYVFQCLGPKCQNKIEQMRVFRTQFDKSKKLSETTVEGNSQQILEKQYKIIPDHETQKEAKEIMLMAEHTINSFALNDDQLKVVQKNQAPISEEDKEFEMAKQYAKQLVEQKEAMDRGSNASSRKSSMVEEDSDDEDDMEKKDKAYTIYDTFIQQLGPHALRFCRDKKTVPLWFSDKNQWSEKHIPNCPSCNKKRVFEFQINNCLLNLYDELIAQDWGIAAVYTCEGSCNVKDQDYVEEFMMLQVGTEDPLTLQEIEQKVKEMQLEDEQMNENQEQEQEEQEEESKEQEQQEQQPKKKKNKKKKQQQQQEEQPKEEEEDDW